ncbi:GNAT family N-acetyltransferase [Candidatus Thorarchaeota archaeon]|nr:MAG: GNAT family N-acetyltransferase [Candidatus Thorarchaeota archaeon]
MRCSTVTETIVRSPKLDEKTSFYQVYGTGIPNVDSLTFDRFSRWWNRSKVQGDLPNLWRVATVDEQVVGIAINSVLESLGWGAIWELVVDREWRNQGIGTSLVLESEQALLKQNPNLTHFVVGVKVHNPRSIPFVERLGYGIQSLVLRLDGDVPHRLEEQELNVNIARLDDIPTLLHLVPDTYWGHRDHKTLEYSIRGGNCYVMREQSSNMVVGFVRFEYDPDLVDTTIISFSYRQGYGISVIEATLEEVATRRAIFWVQDKHEEILDYLYAEDFQRAEAEFVARKRVRHLL